MLGYGLISGSKFGLGHAKNAALLARQATRLCCETRTTELPAACCL